MIYIKYLILSLTKNTETINYKNQRQQDEGSNYSKLYKKHSKIEWAGHV